ncbi:MAG TPA: translation initiation factor IF-2 [Polyangiaceae bacterium]|nr:translation initiation factor IF-2 [Polyangiaceae bacterium]
MTIKMRVYEVARDLGIENKALVALLQSVGVTDAKNHMSAIAPEAIERVKRHLEKQKSQTIVEERIRPTVVKRRAVERQQPSSPTNSRPAPPAEPGFDDGPRSARPSAPVARPSTRPSSSVQPPSAPPVVRSARPQEAAAPPSSAPAPSAPVSRPAPVAAETQPSRSADAAVAKPAPSPVAEAPARPAAPPVTTPTAPAAEAPPAPVVQSPAVSSAPAPAPVAAAPVAPPRAPEAPAAEQPPPAAPPPPFVPQEVRPAPTAAPAAVPLAAAAPEAPVSAPAPRTAPAATPAAASAGAGAGVSAVGVTPPRPPAKTGIDVWEGRPGVPMPQVQRAPTPRRVQYDPKAGALRGRPGQQPAPGMMGGRMPHRGGPMRPGQRGPYGSTMSKGPRLAGPPTTLERSAHKKKVRIEESIGLQGLAGKIGVKATEVLMKLMRLGMTGVNINTTLDAETAKIVANEFGWEVEDVAVSEAAQLVAAQGTATVVTPEERGLRPAVVTVMGHVDHGKTSLLDQIRKSNVASGEAGGITQHIGAYSVETSHGPVTFLDTPGHEAFTAMRMRGAQATDIVILGVAADDGVMPQTREAVNHAKAAKVPIVVAVNKMDKPGADPDRVKRQLSELGLVAEEWGGDTLFCNVSALTRAGVDNLLDQVALQAEVMELRANPNKLGTGLVIEAELDRGRGPVASILVTDGTLNRGDVILAGAAYGKIRAMIDSQGRQVASAGPSTPVSIIGLSDVPSAGDPVHVLKDAKKAQEIAESRKTKEKRSLVPSSGARAMTLEDLAKAMSDTEQLELKLIIKADVQGSVEAVSDALVRLSTEKVKVSVVHSAAGAITEGDVNLAVAAGAIIIGFNVRPAGKAAALAQKENIQIRPYNIIYNVVDEVKAAMEGLLAPTLVEKLIGKAEVRQVFKITKAGAVAGCMVTDGSIKRSAGVRVLRDGAVVWAGKLSGLKRFKDDVREVKEGFDCGMVFDGFGDFKEGDVVEAFEHEEVRQTL